MKFDPDIHHRRSIRLRGYDYARNGAYFVTICLQGRECLLGGIASGEMQMNEAGRMVRSVWQEIPDHYPGVEIDIFAVMPNHFHGIILLVGSGPKIHEKADTGRFVVGAAPRGCPPYGFAAPRPPQGGIEQNGCPVFGKTQKEREPLPKGHPQGGAPTTLALPDIVHRFKSLSTARYRQGVKNQGWQSFPGRLWQRNYYERAIRNDNELQRAQQYIRDNPMKWDQDSDNPVNIPQPIAKIQPGSKP